MTRHVLLLAALLALVPIGARSEQISQEDTSSGQLPSYPATQGYIQQSYPQNFDQEYSLPTRYGSQYYQQETATAIGYHGTNKAVNNDSPNLPYYYYN